MCACVLDTSATDDMHLKARRVRSGRHPLPSPARQLFRGPLTGFFENDLFPPAVRVNKKKHIFNLEVPAAAAAERQRLRVVGGRGAVHQERCFFIEVGFDNPKLAVSANSLFNLDSSGSSTGPSGSSAMEATAAGELLLV